MWFHPGIAAGLMLALATAACHSGTPQPSDSQAPRACDRYAWSALIPGPCEQGHDAPLESLADLYDRQFHQLNAFGMGLNSEVGVPLDRVEERELIRSFLQETDGWDFEAFSGRHPFDVVPSWQPVAGLYAGVGIAADAFRYGVLRDQGYAPADVALARDHLLEALEGLHIATAITGVPGLLARGFFRTDLPGGGAQIETTPLFDAQGNPLPEEKNNGESRADNSGGLYPNYVWTDSCSRDMFIGWTAAFAAAWEVIRDDPAFPASLKARMRADAREIGLQLKVVRSSGFDLEIFDADGRTTYHGYLNEHNFDRLYLPWLPVRNGMYSLMALGIVAALEYVAQDSELESYLYDTLIGERGLHHISRENQLGVDLGVISNYSAYNMAFMGAWLAMRYIEDEAVREVIRPALHDKLYDRPDRGRQPVEIGQSLFDFVYAAGLAGASAWTPVASAPDPDALARGLRTLKEFPVPPYWELERMNCDEEEIRRFRCEAEDGTELDLLGYVGRGNKLVAAQPVPMRIRPASNYHWRSNPYEVNGGGDGTRLLPGVDFRFAYWLGRWVRVSDF